MGVKPEPIPAADMPLRAHLTGPTPALDPRRFIARADFVEVGLADRISAAHYVAPWRQRAVAAVTPVRATAGPASRAVSAVLYGEVFDVFEIVGDWAFGRSVHDDYVGWLPLAALGDPVVAPRTARITARVAPSFAAADIKAPVQAMLPFGAAVAGEIAGNFLALADGGFVHARHIAPLARPTPLGVARRFAGAPYVWGGRTPDGVDCSGLVQAALAACGIAAPRDSDQQRASVGSAVAFNDRATGDLVFFPGHVGILAGRDSLFHANAHWMTTLEEPLMDVIARLRAAGAETPVLGLRRPARPISA
ncbi:hypothetical protein IP88_00495 [alpha proteobacterium AAP81b]|nr:hypothetical protein IP88_00495 [alpha proteobacterium AAP81b]